MPRLSRNARLLCLLTLLQLVGGPLVLCGVMIFTRLATDKDVTLSQSISLAVESAQRFEFQDHSAASPALSPADCTKPQPAKAPAPLPVKSKDGKATLAGMADFLGVTLAPPGSLFLPLSSWHDPAPITRGQAPPLPPPRAA